jgi:OmcA/MtrC family decaheme c-type cytochrome
VEIEYCVTCHNPGSTDANSTNTMDMEVMTHRIHYAVDLPSVRAGGVYQIYGFRDSLHDYSDVVYPGDVRNCTQCHAGAATDVGLTETLLPDGDNWSEYPTRAGCGSCHDDLDFAAHFGGQPDDGDCRSCHALGGIAGSVAANHVDPVRVAAGRYRFEILDVTATARGEFPVIDFRIVDPTNGDAPWDILADAPFVQPMGASRIAITLGWSTTDYTNHGNGDDLASTVSIDALTSATANGDGSFRVTSPVAIPDGTLAPFIATTGSGTVTIEGHPAETIDGAVERIPVTNVHRYFSVNEPSGEAFPRREIASIEQCNVCHASLSIHGDNRTDDLQACATCHNPRNTDRDVRAIALTPPTDGKAEESIDFKTMIHAIHASAERENPLQLVGFRGFTTYVYDTEHVQYPGFLENCTTCHVGDSYRLPLADSVLATSVDTGADLVDPSDDVVVSPATAVCASCHDDAEAVTHMETEGGDFATTQAFVDMGVTVETCAGCHGPGEFVAVDLVHDIEED